MPEFDIRGCPQADSVQLCQCPNPNCMAIHLVCLDENEKPVMSAALSDENWRELLSALGKLLYARAALNDD